MQEDNFRQYANLIFALFLRLNICLSDTSKRPGAWISAQIRVSQGSFCLPGPYSWIRKDL